MAENVVAFDKNAKKEKVNTSEKVDKFVSKNRKPILIGGIVVIAAAIAVCIIIAVTDNLKVKSISAIDSIEYTLTKGSYELSEEDLSSRQNETLGALNPYLSKSGVVGVRANMLAADVAFQKRAYEDSRNYWLKGAAAGKKSYTAAICYYNAGVCSEEMSDLDGAVENYTKASEEKYFYLVTHCLFSLGRVYETKNDVTNAAETYQKLADNYPADKWTDLAKSRLLALKAEGKVND